MNLLSELEGLSGENLCSAVLRLLVIRSQELRDCLINLVSRDSRAGPVTSGSHFSCTLEHPTEDPGRWGRLDLLLETSDAVIGVENKLHAEFQDGQPQKYLKTVTEHAQVLKNLRKRDHSALVAVLAPRSRMHEIEELIGGNEHYLAIVWEELLEALTGVAHRLDPLTTLLVHDLDSYVRQQIAFFPEFSKWLPHFRRKFEPSGTTLQREFVARIWPFFPDAGPRLSCGKAWCGYYFTDASTVGTRGWYGFVPESEISKGAKNAAELIIATAFDVDFREPKFRNIELEVGPDFIGADKIHSWAVDFDDSWDSPGAWDEHLKPLSKAYAAIQNEANTRITHKAR